MGLPFGYSDDLLPKVLMNTFCLLGVIRTFILTLLRLMGLTHFLEPDISWPEPGPELVSLSAQLIRELLPPAMKFSEVGKSGSGSEPGERCTVCLHEFQDHEAIRRLTNCGHIFHRGCVDRWMDHDQKTCPLCRTPFIPHDLVEAIDEIQKCWAPSTLLEFGGDFSPTNVFL